MSLKLLIAEDSDLIRSGLTKFLERFDDIGVTTHARDGKQAVEMAEENQPDVVLMDLRMPVMDGIVATREIKKAQPNCRVLILSSFSDDDEVYAAFAAGADGYCLKSINMDRVYTAVKMVSSGMAFLDPSIAERVLRGPLRPKEGGGGDHQVELTEADCEVLGYLCEGLETADIAERRKVSVDQLKIQLHDLLSKLASSDRTRAAVLAIKQGLA